MAKLRALDRLIRIADNRAIRPPTKSVDSYYRTPAHKQWARDVIRAAGFQCADPMHDESTPRHGRRLFADHITERVDGGAPLDLANGMARCGACHTRKTTAERAKRLRGA